MSLVNLRRSFAPISENYLIISWKIGYWSLLIKCRDDFKYLLELAIFYKFPIPIITPIYKF